MSDTTNEGAGQCTGERAVRGGTNAQQRPSLTTADTYSSCLSAFVSVPLMFTRCMHYFCVSMQPLLPRLLEIEFISLILTVSDLNLINI